MKVLNLSDYFIKYVEEVCRDKFENDIMLIFNNFSNKSRKFIIQNIKISVKNLSDIGVVFDNNLIKIICSMYLGLAWSMHRKGKLLQKDKNILTDFYKNDYNKLHIIITEILCDDYDYVKAIDELAVRYYTLYFSQHFNDIFYRMKIHKHPYIDDEVGFKNVILEDLKNFGLKILANGIIEEYKNNI